MNGSALRSVQGLRLVVDLLIPLVGRKIRGVLLTAERSRNVYHVHHVMALLR